MSITIQPSEALTCKHCGSLDNDVIDMVTNPLMNNPNDILAQHTVHINTESKRKSLVNQNGTLLLHLIYSKCSLVMLKYNKLAR